MLWSKHSFARRILFISFKYMYICNNYKYLFAYRAIHCVYYVRGAGATGTSFHFNC